MSSLCAIADFYSHSINFELIRSMSRAMLLRGKRGGGAYINGALGLVQCPEGDVFPFTLNLGGKRYTAIIDGSPYFPGSEENVASSLLRRYAASGKEALCELCGDFALMILDEYEGRLILARDALGARPLYYCQTGRALAAASEIKGLLPLFPDGARVCLDAYRSLLVAPCGTVGGSELYRDIRELEASQILDFDGRDITLSSYRCIYPERTPEHQGLTLPARCDSIDKNLLCELLVAFDYPSFDMLMPSMIKLFREQRGKEKIFYQEPYAESDERYALQRADRLGAICGVNAVPLPSRAGGSLTHSAAKATERRLTELLSELEPARRQYLLELAGSTAISLLKKSKSPAIRARTLALILQTDFWTENYRLRFG